MELNLLKFCLLPISMAELRSHEVGRDLAMGWNLANVSFEEPLTF